MYKSSVERTYLDLGCLFCLCSYKITVSETDGLTSGFVFLLLVRRLLRELSAGSGVLRFSSLFKDLSLLFVLKWVFSFPFL